MKRRAAALWEVPPLRMPTKQRKRFSIYALRPARPCAVQLAHQIVLVLALAGRGLGVFGFSGALAGLDNIGVDAFQRPLLIAARHIVPDLRLCAVGGVHAHKVDVFIRQHIADAGTPAAGGLQRPALTQPAGAAPLVQPCALHHTAKGQIHHLAGKAVANAPAALARIHELPLLPWMACIAPQLDGRAVLGVEVLYFQHLSIGGFDDVKFIFQNDCLRCLCHRARLLSSLVALL